ncbi:ComEC/Rec2 family competence protein [Corallococcus sp. EGB]|uniref:ComEC/Rec2 family competence protein n=1 Tax=Corallococcus sp. EGB TaxID=1521117 RepID=UPI001CBDD8DD|nr:hypothetical protein [Corallococcus sp. EGB]
MYTARLRIIHFDVSQGESSLISLLGPLRSHHVLIDGGRKCRGKYVTRILEELGIPRLDFIICTHLDNDHHEGLVPVVKSTNFGIGTLLVPKFGHNADKFETLKRACQEQGVTWSIATQDQVLFNSQSCSLTIKHVGTPELRDDNTASIACLLQMNEFKYYTGGDLPWAMEEQLDLGNHVCAFKVGHHGAETSTSATFVAGLNPSAAFISAGRHAHGHPRQEILDYLYAEPSVQRVYSTNCIHPRVGFHDEDTRGAVHAKGLVCSNRTHGVLGHIVVYTDDKLSRQHADSKVGFFVLRPPPQGQGPWRAYKHVCSNLNHLAKRCLPGGVVHLREHEYPEYRLAELSPSVQNYRAKRLRLKPVLPFTFGNVLGLDGDGRRTELRPGSPIHQFIEDPPNFTVAEDPPTTTAPKRGHKRKQTTDHADEGKRLGACVGCTEAPDGDPSGEELVECSHGEAWYACADCRPLFKKGFDCDA